MTAAKRVLVWVATLAIFAFAVTFTVGHFGTSTRGRATTVGAAHDPAIAVGHRHGSETPQIRGLHPQPASRTRAVLAVLAVGIVVAALARRKLLLGARAVAPAFRRAGLRSGRGPPLARIA
jgi:hypothetical protein